MAMVPERSKPLHNFSLPCLKWGSQRFLRCVNVPSSNDPSPQPSSSPSLDRRTSRPQFKSNQTEPPRVPKRKPNQNVDGVSGKNFKISNFEDAGGEEEGGGGSNNRHWNLRTRRAACKAPPPPQAQAQGPKQAHDEEHLQVKENKNKMMMMYERAKFSVSLSKEEVEQDYWGLVGTRPPRRPKKRPRIVQRQLDTLFPGLWLTEITAESYKVSDVPE